MRTLRRALYRIAGMFTHRRRDEELALELEANIEMTAAENMRRGMSAEEARRQAIMQWGGLQQTKERVRAQRGIPAVEHFVADVRFATRMLRNNPGFSAVAVLTLALGLGSATSVFSVANAVLLRQMPYPDAERIVLVWGSDGRGDHRGQVSFTNIEDIRHRNRVFSAIANFADWTPTLSGMGEPERLAATQVSDGFFDVIGVQPMLGRAFTSEEHIDGRDRVVILSYALWKSRFNSDKSVIGRTISLNLTPHVVVGVMPPDFEELPSTLVQGGQLYRPVGETYDDTQRRSEHLRAIARLKAGVTLSQAQADVERIAREMEAEHPKEDADVHYAVAGLHEDTTSELKPSLMLLSGAVAMLLLIACSNVAGLLLARGTARQKEFAVRTALGASRMRIVRQALTEALVLAFAGGALGITLAVATTRICVALAPKLGSPLAHATIDLKVLAFAVCAVIITTMLFGVAPALQTAGSNIAVALKQGAQTASASRGSKRFHACVVVGELALALILLSTATLLVRGFVQLQHVDLGYQVQGRLVMNVWLPSVKYRAREQQSAFYDELMRRVSSMPGVRSAALVQNAPMVTFDGRAMLPEGVADVPQNLVSPEAYFVTPGYLQTMGIPQVRGRWFTDADNEKSQLVAVISAGFAERLWPGQDPIGKRLQLRSDKKVDGQYPFRTVVGVVGDVHHLGPNQRVQPSLYVPFRQFTTNTMSLVVHADKPMVVAQSIRKTMAALDPDIALFGINTYEDLLSDQLLVRRVAMTLIAAFAGIAVFLAAVGLYGLIAYVVSRRMREFGVRAALGAQPRDLLRLVLGSGLRLVGLGAAIGVTCSAVAVRVVGSLIAGTRSADGATVAGSAGILVSFALIASVIPARTAANANPMTTLRSE